VEISDSGEPINKYYHVILHYERIAEDESKFEAMHNTIMGNYERRSTRSDRIISDT
jgi:hypothetical protein